MIVNIFFVSTVVGYTDSITEMPDGTLTAQGGDRAADLAAEGDQQGVDVENWQDTSGPVVRCSALAHYPSWCCK